MNLRLAIFPPLCILPRVISCTYHVTDKEYDVLLPLAKGTFQIPVRDRTNVQEAAVIKFWRKKTDTHSLEMNYNWMGKR